MALVFVVSAASKEDKLAWGRGKEEEEEELATEFGRSAKEEEEEDVGDSSLLLQRLLGELQKRQVT